MSTGAAALLPRWPEGDNAGPAASRRSRAFFWDALSGWALTMNCRIDQVYLTQPTNSVMGRLLKTTNERSAGMNQSKQKFIMNLELLNLHNSEGCPACGNKFFLGDPVVVACGAWQGSAKMIHEYEAVFDHTTQQY
jgi:hypothetical protein